MAVINALHAVTRHATDAHSLAARCDSRCLRAWKLCFSGALIVEVIIAFGLALRVVSKDMHDRQGYARFLRLANCGSAGVGLATAMLHLFREAEIQMDIVEHGHTHAGTHSPMVYNCFLAVYFVLLLADRVLRRPKGCENHNDVDFLNEFEAEARVGTSVCIGTGVLGPDYRKDSEFSTESFELGTEINGFGTSQFSAASHTVASAAARIAVECVALGSGNHIVLVAGVFVAIASRTWAVAASLVPKFRENKLSTQAVIVLVALFTSAAPLGVGLGSALAQAGNVVRAIVTVLMGGVFFYFSACSTPADEFVENREHVVAKFCLMFFGASVVVLLTSLLAVGHVY